MSGDAPDAGRDGGGDARVEAVERLLAAVAARAEIATRLEPPGLERILRSVVDATATLFDAEAASIALAEDDGRLRFRVAAGERGQGVVGLTVDAGQGVAGYVASTGQPLALADVAADPRFGRDTAQATGYLPSSILAVPLELDDRVIGVLEVLDRRGGRPFDLGDIARAGVFARQAAVAIDAARVEGGIGRLLLDGLATIAGSGAGAGTGADQLGDLSAPLDEIVAGAMARLDDGGPAFWSLVDRVAALRASDPTRLALVSDLLDVAVAHLAGSGRPAAQGGPSWRDRAGLRDEEDE